MFSYVDLVEAVNEKDSIKFEEAFDYIMKAKVASAIEEIRSNIVEQKADPKIVARFAKVPANKRSYYIMKWAEENGIDISDAMKMAGYKRNDRGYGSSSSWIYVGESLDIDDYEEDEDEEDEDKEDDLEEATLPAEKPTPKTVTTARRDDYFVFKWETDLIRYFGQYDIKRKKLWREAEIFDFKKRFKSGEPKPNKEDYRKAIESMPPSFFEKLDNGKGNASGPWTKTVE